MKAKLNKITDKIFHLEFYDRVELTHTFIRFQEYFESPKFRGKIFSLAEYKAWYKKDHGGKFSYAQDWSGFNIPSNILKPFLAGKFDPLNSKEKWFLKQFSTIKGKFYIIGTSLNSKSVLKHEIAHGLFYTNKNYKLEVLEILKTIDQEAKDKVFSKLVSSGGYHKNSFVDELHAYVLGDANYWGKGWGLEDAHRKLNMVFDKYYLDKNKEV